MKRSLEDFRALFRDRILDLLWRQWSSLGVSGHGPSWHGAPVDPESLLLFSCTVARHDARLFDAMVEWTGLHGRYINVQRLKRILAEESYAGGRVFRAVAATVMDSVSVAKWARSAATDASKRNPEPLFYLKDGRPMPLVGESDPAFAEHGYLRDQAKRRGVARPFRPGSAANLILKLRALLGVNARCEIMAFLLLNRQGSPRSVARNIYYYPATVSKTLGEMRDSGYVISRVQGRHRYHLLVPDTWRDLLLGATVPPWITWPRLFSGLEMIWSFLSENDFAGTSALAQASAIRRLLLGSVVEKLDTSMTEFAFGDIAGHTGEALTPYFVERTVALLDGLDSVSAE